MKKSRTKGRIEDLVGIGVPATKFPAYEPMMTAYIWADEEEPDSASKEAKVA